MSAIINIPFNFQPVNTGAVNNSSYTVPNGKYARVVILLTATATASMMFPPINASQPCVSVQSNQVSAELWLKSGDVISFSSSPATGSFTSAFFNGSSNGGGVSGTSTATALLNGTPMIKCLATAFAGFGAGNAVSSVAIVGDTSGLIQFSEYNNIS
jgi:hypothetical protein